QLNNLEHEVEKKRKNAGRMFYLGAGSGGRLSVIDVREMPTTNGVSKGLLNAILAGGTEHMVEALEEKEDDVEAGWRMLQEEQISEKDIVIGISASGTTPFVLAGLKQCRANNITTGCIVSNPNSII